MSDNIRTADLSHDPHRDNPNVSPPSSSPEGGGTPEHPDQREISTGSEIVLLRIEMIAPNDYNPNTMTDHDYRALVTATKVRGSNPQVIQVRRVGDRYVIINGEHNFHAGRDAGLEKVRCEVIEVDEFDAMRQTLAYNRHGDHNPLLEGLMYLEMQQERDLSKRQLAKVLEISESKVRNRLNLVTAAVVRFNCKPEEVRDKCRDSSEELELISSLTPEQCRTYLALHDRFRDIWLDAGARMEPLKKTYFFDATRDIVTGMEIVEQFVDSGVLHFVDAGPKMESSMRYVYEIYCWSSDHFHIKDIGDYTDCVLECELPKKVLDYLPFGPQPGGAACLVTVDKWKEILRESSEASNREQSLAMVSNAIHAALTELGLDPSDYLSQRNLDKLTKLHQVAPDYIANAEFLSIDERCKLNEAGRYTDRHIEDQAKRMTVEQLREARANPDPDGPSDIRTVIQVYEDNASALREEQRKREEESFFSTPDHLVDRIVSSFGESLTCRTIGDRAAADVLKEDLAALPSHLLPLFAAGVFDQHRNAGISRWIEAASNAAKN